MSVLSNLRVYGHGKWQVKNVEKLSEEDVASIKSAEVCPSRFEGKASICLVLKSGGVSYLPVDQNCSCEIGQSVDPNSIEIVTLSAQGEPDAIRARF